MDVESQLPTRRYLNVVLHDLLVVPLCRASNLYKRGKSALVNNTNTDNSSTTTTTTATHSEWGSSGSDSGVLFTQLIDHLNFYLHFEIDEMSGQALTVQDVAQHHYSRLHSLQKLVFTKFARELPEFALLNVGKIESPANFKLALGSVSDEVLVAICREIGVRTEPHVERAAATATAAISQNVNNNNMMDTDNDDTTSYSKDFLLGVLCERYAKRLGQMASINGLPLYPDEVREWKKYCMVRFYIHGSLY